MPAVVSVCAVAAAIVEVWMGLGCVNTRGAGKRERAVEEAFDSWRSGRCRRIVHVIVHMLISRPSRLGNNFAVAINWRKPWTDIHRIRIC
jgi:hypothetical protein